jgi:hypothetical protein
MLSGMATAEEDEMDGATEREDEDMEDEMDGATE